MLLKFSSVTLSYLTANVNCYVFGTEASSVSADL